MRCVNCGRGVELRSEAGEYRAQTEQLRRELQASRTRAVRMTSSAASATEASARLLQLSCLPAPIEDRVAALEESSQLLNSKIIDQYQSKIEAHRSTAFGFRHCC